MSRLRSPYTHIDHLFVEHGVSVGDFADASVTTRNQRRFSTLA